MSAYDQQRIEQFLLGGLTSFEQEEIEQRIFADDDLFARVEEVETDLIDGYVRGTLSEPILGAFERSLRENPARVEKVAFARLLARRADRTGKTLDNLLPFTTRNATAIRLALVAALLVLVVGLPLTMRRASTPDNSTTPEFPPVAGNETTEPNIDTTSSGETVETLDTATVAIKRPPVPTVAVKQPPIPEVTSEAVEQITSSATRSVTFVVSVMTLRSGVGAGELLIGSDVDVIEMQIGLESDEFPNYSVDIRDSARNSVWTGSDFRLQRSITFRRSPSRSPPLRLRMDGTSSFWRG